MVTVVVVPPAAAVAAPWEYPVAPEHSDVRPLSCPGSSVVSDLADAADAVGGVSSSSVQSEDDCFRVWSHFLGWVDFLLLAGPLRDAEQLPPPSFLTSAVCPSALVWVCPSGGGEVLGEFPFLRCTRVPGALVDLRVASGRSLRVLFGGMPSGNKMTKQKLAPFLPLPRVLTLHTLC